MKPPQHAAVFLRGREICDSGTGSAGPSAAVVAGASRARDAIALYGALDVKNSKVEGKTARRHTSAEFVEFLGLLVEKARWAQEIHIVLDNLSAHETQAVRDFLEANPKVRFHFTPTYSSWLNQVEIWFIKIERDVISSGVFTSVADLSRMLMKYIRAYDKSALPIRWTYTDPKASWSTHSFGNGPRTPRSAGLALHGLAAYGRLTFRTYAQPYSNPPVRMGAGRADHRFV
jgi:transposase